jgi:hypothetical protein
MALSSAGHDLPEPFDPARVPQSGGMASRLLAGITVLLLSASAASAAKGGAKPSFASDVVLPGGQGGEPSIAIDTSPTAGRGNIYVGAIGDANGPLEWHSYDGGASWSQPVPFDLAGPLRGGDEDLVVNTNGDLLATDLDVAYASVQISTAEACPLATISRISRAPRAAGAVIR